MGEGAPLRLGEVDDPVGRVVEVVSEAERRDAISLLADVVTHEPRAGQVSLPPAVAEMQSCGHQRLPVRLPLGRQSQAGGAAFEPCVADRAHENQPF